MTGCIKVDLEHVQEEDPYTAKIMGLVAENFSWKFKFLPFVMGWSTGHPM
jgi:hypothetical protein